MRRPLRNFSQTLALGWLLAAGATGCFLLPAPRSDYRTIHQCAKDGDAAGVALILATNGAALNLPDDAGLTPLHLAAAYCHTNVLLLLLDQGADIERKAKGGITPLHSAAQEGCLEAVTLLLNRGAEVNARDSAGRTPVKRAEQWHQDAVVPLLRQHGGTE